MRERKRRTIFSMKEKEEEARAASTSSLFVCHNQLAPQKSP
jgi:hypothetical protein